MDEPRTRQLATGFARVRPRSRVARQSRNLRAELRSLHRRRVHATRRRTSSSRRSTRRTKTSLATVAQAERDATSTEPWSPRATPTTRCGPRPAGRTCEVPVSDRPAHPGAGARARGRRDAGRRQAHQASRATSTSRSPRRTSSTTRGGPTSSATPASGRDPRPLGVAGADHPLELPAPHGGVEAGARARVREHRRAEAGRDDAAHARWCSPRSSSRRSCRPGS